MMERKATLCIRTLPLQVAMLCFVACHSTPYQKSDVAGQSLRVAAIQVQAEKQAIDDTVAALREMIEKPAPDLKPQFQGFSAALDRLIATAQNTESIRKRMAEKNALYFAAWNEQLVGINYGAIRERSDIRRSEVTNTFYSVDARYEQAKGAVGSLISYFGDIRKALSADLTMRGLDSLRSIVSETGESCRKAQVTLGELAGDLLAASNNMSSLATANPPSSESVDTAERKESRDQVPIVGESK